MKPENLQVWKMNGLGNDFVIIDARTHPFVLHPDWAKTIANREILGCDQVVVLQNPTRQQANVEMLIYNADGSQSGACGNATRCVAYLIAQEFGSNTTNPITIQTQAGLLQATVHSAQNITVDMGEPNLEASQIPLSSSTIDTLSMPIELTLNNGTVLSHPVGVNMGNPHAVFFIDCDPYTLPLHEFGATLEHDPLFPERANIGLCQVINPQELILRVWERGSGITQACGTGACAALVAARRKGLSDAKATVHLPGGDLTIEWLPNNHVLMSGPITMEREGHLLANLNLEALSS